MFKQILSSFFVHFLNVFLSILFNQQDTDSKNECASYLMSVLCDSTIGIILTVVLVKISNRIARKQRLFMAVQGNYLTQEQKIDKEAYGIQCCIWLVDVFLSKTGVFLVYLINVAAWNAIGQALLSPFSFSQVLQLVIVVVIVPTLTNTYSFLIFDTLLKKKTVSYEIDPKLLKMMKLGSLDDHYQIEDTSQSESIL